MGLSGSATVLNRNYIKLRLLLNNVHFSVLNVSFRQMLLINLIHKLKYRIEKVVKKK